MAMTRQDLGSRRIDFSDIASGRRLPSVHHGEILRQEFLTPKALSVDELANAIKVPRSRLNDVALGRRAVSTDTAMRPARYLVWRDNLDERRATIWMRTWCRGGDDDRGNDYRAQESLLV